MRLVKIWTTFGLQTNTVQERIRILNESIESKIGDSKDELRVQAVVGDMSQDWDDDVFVCKDDDDLMEITDKDADNYTPEMFDAYLSAWVLLPHGGELLKAQIVGQKRDANGNPVGQAHSNPILDTRDRKSVV